MRTLLAFAVIPFALALVYLLLEFRHKDQFAVAERAHINSLILFGGVLYWMIWVTTSIAFLLIHHM